jgi:hypothetical protein
MEKRMISTELVEEDVKIEDPFHWKIISGRKKSSGI